jgi:16S rRNA (guanine966-N2)-methyltransferase
MLRITGGELRGRRVRWSRNPSLRPTTDRVRESVFAVLEEDLPGAAVLDLFAGTGIVGLEALSRGAARVTFVDSHGPALRRIEDALRELHVPSERAETVRADARSFLKRSSRGPDFFDIIFSDPPYESLLGADCLELLGSRRSPGFGVYVWERAAEEDVEPEGNLQLVRTQRFGGTRVEHWVRTGGEPGDRSRPIPPARS